MYLSLRAAKGTNREDTLGSLRRTIAVEYARHPKLLTSSNLLDSEIAYTHSIVDGTAPDTDYALPC